MWERLIYRLKQSSGPILIEFFPIVPRITVRSLLFIFIL